DIQARRSPYRYEQDRRFERSGIDHRASPARERRTPRKCRLETNRDRSNGNAGNWRSAPALRTPPAESGVGGAPAATGSLLLQFSQCRASIVFATLGNAYRLLRWAWRCLPRSMRMITHTGARF